MLIQALYDRYCQLADDPESGVCELYYSIAGVSFLLELDGEGELLSIRDLREMKGKKLAPIRMIVPEQSGRTSGVKPFFLCDKAEYILGHHTLPENETEQMKKKQDAEKKFHASRDLHLRILQEFHDPEAKAICRFFEQWEPGQLRENEHLQTILLDLDKGMDTVLAFQHKERHAPVHENLQIRQLWKKYRQDEGGAADEQSSQCLVTGSCEAIARVHDVKLKGVRGAQSSGAALISFNKPSFESYGKDQSYNAPVGKTAAFGYATALNHLLASDQNCIKGLGDMTVVFWSSGAGQASVQAENLFSAFFEPDYKTNTDTSEDAHLKDILERIRSGHPLTADMLPGADATFHILGLSPNNARLAVRMYWQGNLGSLIHKISDHATDFSLKGSRRDTQQSLPSVYHILTETMRVGSDGKKVGEGPTAVLVGQLFRSVVEGRVYPHALYTGILNRIRADGIVSHIRVQIIKAYLKRSIRFGKYSYLEEALSVALDKEIKVPAYRLGRLFAVLERAQQNAAGGYNRLNATIKDRYFSSASATPAAVFPILIRLSGHHMKKMEFGFVRDMEIQEILKDINEFPSHLNLQEQGTFVLGYYHQKESFFSKNQEKSESSSN